MRVVTARTGLSPHVLRAWERRYEAVAPGRSAAGQRLYSDADVDRLALLLRATQAGRAIGQVVRIPVDELARFLQLHLRDGELDGTRILSPQSAAAMRQITMLGRRYDLGLGWFRPASQRNADPPFVQHLGGGAGFFNLIRIYPTRGVGVAVMGNVTKYPIDAVARLALTH